MGKIRNGISVLSSNIYCTLLKIMGTRLINNIQSMISHNSTIVTRGNKASINVGYRSRISPYSELSASENGNLVIGNNCFVNRNCVIACHSSIILGNDVTIGPGTYIYDHDHDGKGGYISKPIKIGNNVWIGAGCIILKGVTIGDNVVVAAGVLVNKDVPSSVLLYQKRYTYVVSNRELK